MFVALRNIQLVTKSVHKYNVRMRQLKFEWDNKKDKINAKKHGVSFDEARTVFFDEKAIQFYDPEHSDEEDRFILYRSKL